MQEACSTPPTVKYVPTKAKTQWAAVFVRALAAAVHFNTMEAWTEFAMLPGCVLCPPPVSNKLSSADMAAFTLDRISRWQAGERATLWADRPPAKKGGASTAAQNEAKRFLRAESLCREGLLGKACAALGENDLCRPSPQVWELLKDLHPGMPLPQPLNTSTLPSAPLFCAADIDKALRSFPKGTGAGPSGLRAQHIVDALTNTSKEAVLSQLTEAVNWLSAAHAPPEVAAYLGGAHLVAFRKKTGGVRPIAVGEVMRRLVAKCLCESVKTSAIKSLWPLQAGCGSKLGAESAVHVARQWCERHALNQHKVALRLDFANAFNCVSREAMLAAVIARAPELSRWAHFCYSNPVDLKFGSWNVKSETGVHQGDPLGALFFSLAIQPLLEELATLGLDLCLFYLDDG